MEYPQRNECYLGSCDITFIPTLFFDLGVSESAKEQTLKVFTHKLSSSTAGFSRN